MNNSNPLTEAAALLEAHLIEELPTPEIVEKLMEKGYFAPSDLARIVTHMAFYAFRDTSNVDRSTEALSNLIGFMHEVEKVVKRGLVASELLERFAENLVDAGAKQEVASRN